MEILGFYKHPFYTYLEPKGKNIDSSTKTVKLGFQMIYPKKYSVYFLSD